MIKVDIISGFLGAGKTTLIKKLLEDQAFAKEKVALIENEYGEIGIDGTILKDYGIEMKEMNSGCICCTIAGDFHQALKEIIRLYRPERIVIEPSGVGKLSDVMKGCGKFMTDGAITLNICMTVIDALKYQMYLKNFAEFYKDQLIHAKTIILSRTQRMKPDQLEHIYREIRKYNSCAPIITTEWELISGKDILEVAENAREHKLEDQVMKELLTSGSTDKSGKRIINRKKSDDIKTRFHPGWNSTGHHHADEVFMVWGMETAKVFDCVRLKEILQSLENVQGTILRAKGIVPVEKNGWIQFDYVPGESSLRETKPDYTGRICVIGEGFDASELTALFGI